MSKTRQVQDEEHALWREVMRDVRRVRKKRPLAIAADKRVADKPKVAVRSEKAPHRAKPSPTPKPKAAPTGVGLDGSTSAKLKRGKILPEATLDLHGLTQAQAHLRLITFVRRCAERDFRCVLVITGKGAPASKAMEMTGRFEMPQRSQSGVLRLMVPRWLEEGDTRGFVAGSQAAHVRHGGDGALYVYLRRKR